MLQRRDYIERIFSELQVKDFTISEHKEIVSTIMNLFDKGEKISLQKVMDKIEKPDIISLISRIMLRDVISLDTGAIERSIKAIKTNKLKLELGRIKGAIQEEEKRNKEVTPELLQEYQEIMHKIKTMA